MILKASVVRLVFYLKKKSFPVNILQTGSPSTSCRSVGDLERMPHDIRAPSYTAFHGLWHQMSIHTKAFWPPQTSHDGSSFRVVFTDCWVDRGVRWHCHWMTVSMGKAWKRSFQFFVHTEWKILPYRKLDICCHCKKHRQVIQKYIFIEFTNTVISNTFSTMSKVLPQNWTQRVKFFRRHHL